MERKIVSSSNIKSVGYLLGVLEIEFKSRTIYQYKNIPEKVYKNLINSYSKGSYFSEYIKEKYPCIKIK